MPEFNQEPPLASIKGWLKKHLPEGIFQALIAIKKLALTTGERWRLIRKQARQSWVRILNFLRMAPGLPPPDLVFLVAGTNDLRWFLKSGRLAYQSLENTLKKNGVILANLKDVLDFGCGAGRVIRHFSKSRRLRIHGSDYNEALISWCRDHIRFARFEVNGLREKLSYEDRSFDLIYALSVFTHLDETLQIFWIDELTRVLRPGGYFFVTVHGEFHLEDTHAAEEDKVMFKKGQPVIYGQEVSGTNMCNVLHPPSYMKERFAPGLELLDSIPRGALGNPQQDVYLYRKPSPTASTRE